MKKWRKIIAGALCLVMFATVFSACDTKNPGSDSDDKIDQEKSEDLQFLFSGVDSNQTTHPAIIAMNKFIEQYGRNVEFVTCGYDEWNQKVVASIASGSPIDVVNASTYQYPLFAMKRQSQPIDDYVNLKSDYIDINVMKSLFSYQGKYYNASPKDCSLPLMIYYNKDLIESEGYDDPYELYQKDEWNYENFKKIAKDFTRDVNGDGKTDQWGLAAWYQWVFFGGSMASVCKINDAGKYELNMANNPALLEALQLIQSAWATDKWVGVEGSDIYSSFYAQKNVMINEFTWAGKTIMEEKKKDTFSFEVGCVPFPYGEQNPEHYNYCFSDGFSILNNAGAPYSAGRLIDMILEETYKNAQENKGIIPEEWWDLYSELRQKPFNSSYYDSAIDSGKDLCAKVGDGSKTIAQAIEMFTPKYQGLLDQANKIPEDKIEREFTPFEINFADGIDSVEKASETESLSLSQDNGALKVDMKTATYNDACPAFRTIPEKNRIYGYKKYKVSFEYKVADIANSDLTGYTFTLGHDGVLSDSSEILIPEEEAINNFVQGEIELDGVADNSENFFIELGGYYANTIWFKNLKVEEVK